MALATGLLSGSPGFVLGLVPAVAAALVIALALGARRLAGALARRSMRARVAAGARPSARAWTRRCGCCGRGDLAIVVGAAGYMLFDVAMLGVCFPAFGNDVPPVGVLLVAYIIGQLGGLIPIPGGIGGIDAGLIGTLVIYGVDATDAAVAVIAYRGLLLAIPALLGLPALAVLRRRLQDEAHDIAACAPGESVEVLGRGVWSIPSPPWPRRAKRPVVRRSPETSARHLRCRAGDRVRANVVAVAMDEHRQCTARTAQPLASVSDRIRLGGDRPGPHPATGLVLLDEAAAKLRRRARRSRARSSGRRYAQARVARAATGCRQAKGAVRCALGPQCEC